MIDLKGFIKKRSDDVRGVVKSVPRVSTDTRTLLEGDLFLALSGENFDGNKFIKGAIEKGAVGCVYRKDDSFDVDNLSTLFPEVFFIGVGNTEKYIQDLAQYHHSTWRSNRDTVTVGITGSNGKTSTKELLAGLLEALFPEKILFTQGNLNNHLGVPMTLLRLNSKIEICILEMGTNHPGEIPFLCKIGDPDAGMITNIGQSHLEFFHTESNVFKEKRSLYDYVKAKDGCFSVDGDNEFLKTLDENDKLSKLGFENGTTKLSLDGTKLDFSGALNFTLDAPHLFGIHNFKNLALSVSLVLQLFPDKEEEVVGACKDLSLPKNNRSELIEKNEKLIFLDAYNANPSSMIASLETFKSFLEDNNKSLEDCLFVLGDMNELGEKSPEYHEQIGGFLKSMGIIHAAFVGRFAKFYNSGFGGTGKTFATTENLKENWQEHCSACSNIFLKGSRTLQLESLVALI